MTTEIDYERTLSIGLLDGLASTLHTTALDKGFWDEEVTISFVLAKLALVHSEVSEVLEAIRKEQGEAKVVEEMADIIIRLLDLYAGMCDANMIQTSLDDAIAEKLEKNKTRPKMHGVLA
jgi:NTP pyrophosphatase (non-canonical NTP hydrolase)